MNILAINGSPRKDGVTALMLERIMAGISAAGGEVELIRLADEKVHHCTGEFHCWFQKPGVCLWDNKQGDTMASVRQRFGAADMVILGTPVYVDGMTGLMKNMLDRMIPNSHPFTELDEHGDFRHPLRAGEKGKKVVLVSCSGFPEIDTFSALELHIERMTRNLRGEFVGRLLRPYGMSLVIPNRLTEDVRDSILGALERAGRELVETGRVDPATEQAVSVNIVEDKAAQVKVFNALFETLVKQAAS